jgi:hypothetical protein
MPHWIPANAFVARILTAQNGQVVPGGGKHILIACMPKSASTYLCGIISVLPEMSQAILTAGHHRREQELCPMQCALKHDMNYVAAHHVRYSRATQDLLTSYNIFPVVLVRNILDCLVSMREHLVRESLDIPQAYVPRNFHELTARRQYDFIVEFIVPWYASFFASWCEYDGPVVHLAYEQLIQDFPAAVARILETVSLTTSRKEIEIAIAKVNPKETRFNVGRVGRGKEELTEDQMEKIRQQFSFFTGVPGLYDILAYDGPDTSTGPANPMRSGTTSSFL